MKGIRDKLETRL